MAQHWSGEMGRMQPLPWGDTVRFVAEEWPRLEAQRQLGGNILAWNNWGTGMAVEAGAAPGTC